MRRKTLTFYYLFVIACFDYLYIATYLNPPDPKSLGLFFLWAEYSKTQKENKFILMILGEQSADWVFYFTFFLDCEKGGSQGNGTSEDFKAKGGED